MASLDTLRVSFFQECEDLLDRLADGLRQLAADPVNYDIETVHAVFRAVHSIKGGGGAFGLDDLVGFAHLYETVLDGLRTGRTVMEDALMQTLLRAGDVLADLVTAARDGVPPPAELTARVATELEQLAGGHGDKDESFAFEPMMLSLDPIEAEAPSVSDGPRHDIYFAPQGELYVTGNEPAGMILALSRLGTVQVEADLSEVRPLADFSPEQPGLRWRITLDGCIETAEIERVFEFVEDIAQVRINLGPPPSQEEEPTSPAEAVEEAGVAAQIQPTAEILALPLAAAGARGAPAAPPPVAQDGAVATIRVNLARVDKLINLIGELVIMEAMLSQVIAKAGLDSNSEAASGLDRIRQLAGEIQESVMAIRAQPLRPVFQRMERILREVTEATGKKARLVTVGEATEVDKTVIERLIDPLTHMIRNSVDHGLESAAARQAAGKPVEGTITLSAAHRSGRVIIEVADDGGGIDRPRVRDIAERKGLIPTGAVLGPSDIDSLLFLPGFSSKTEVSAISGRGVGLDVVRREIQALGGRVSISSVDGAGTTFTIALPLTLAVLEGMLLEFGGQTMVLPLSSIVETLSPASSTIHALGRSNRVVLNRGELIPILDLVEVFDLPRLGDPPEQGVLVIIVTDAGTRAALAVDRILDQRQVVIKSIEDNYHAVPGISAATILGDGHVALIIDPEELVRSARSEHAPPLLSMKG
ncbi:chemotaxis protein CheA [Gemmobacter denitrificans]|uniref:Chemotaxis protein CheA n=1 Tax=Gemmobacter denitrificans TaxID=3123040 RepID=A0ABU8BSF0_9RHOB